MTEPADKAAIARGALFIAGQLTPGVLRNLTAEENAGAECMVWYVDDDSRRRRACDFGELQAMARICHRLNRLHTLLRDGGATTLRLVSADDETAVAEPDIMLTQSELETVLARAVRDALAAFKQAFAVKTLFDQTVAPDVVLELVDTVLQQLATNWPLTPVPEVPDGDVA